LGNNEEPGVDSLAVSFGRKDSISGFLSWTKRTLRFEVREHCGTVVTGKGSPGFISDYGAQRA